MNRAHLNQSPADPCLGAEQLVLRGHRIEVELEEELVALMAQGALSVFGISPSVGSR